LSASLVAVDWGTSSLRAARLGDGGQVLEERSAPRGILTVAPGEFPSVLQSLCGDWRDGGTPTLVSGMAGSRQGWQEAAYCACPAGADDLAGKLSWVEPGRTAIVPGLSCEHAGVPDVMRGEETQVFGALALLGRRDARIVLPGTHSKWVQVRAGRVESFATSMTGEVYALLRTHSILARMMPAEDAALDETAFLQGVSQAQAVGSLLATAFSARTLALFERMPAAALPSYLSGLVIGEELRAQAAVADGEVVIVAAPALAERYAMALRARGQRSVRLGAEATWRGLWQLACTGRIS
jgi:2-dehydro-3-deoxygalactonokinase